MNQNRETEYKSPPVGQEISCVMHGIKKDFLLNNNLFESLLKEALQKDKFNVLNFVSHSFTPKGYTAVALLSDSHLAIHTYPEHDTVYFNMYSCRGPKDSEKTFNFIKEKLKPVSILFFKNEEVRVKK